MAKATPGPILSNIAGSIGGLTFRNDRSGLTIGLKQQPTRKQTDAQLQHRLFFSEGARAWSALDADIQLAWNTLAKTQHIPSFFSRGRTWTGRQLFTCFYIFARHQMTPLPGRWLPTPPLFFETPYSTFDIFNIGAIDNEDPPPETLSTEASSLTAGLPASISPIPSPQRLVCGAASIFCAYSPYNTTRPPRCFSRVAPAHPSLLSSLGYSPAYFRASSFDYWGPVLISVLGFPPGTSPATSGYFVGNWRFWMKTFQVTNERLYYSKPISAVYRYTWFSSDRSNAWFGARLMPPSPWWIPARDEPWIPHV